MMEKIKKTFLKTVKICNESNMPVYAGNATLFLITAAFPFMMLLIAIVNLLPSYSPKDVTELIFRILPNLGAIQELVEGMVTNLKSQSGGLLASIAALTTLWSASGGVNAIRLGLNEIDGGDKGKGIHNVAKRLVFTLMTIVLFPAILVFNMLGSSVRGILSNIVERIGGEGITQAQEGIASFFHASDLAVGVLAVLAILLLYAHLPAARHSLKSCLPGAVFTGACWFAFTKLFSIFIPRFYQASRLYGSLASLFLALLWVRIVMMILFAGGALNKALESPD